MKTVRVGQVVLWGSAPVGGEGFVIDPDGFDGWEDGVDTRRDTADLPQAHGSFDVPGFLEARTLSFSGNCIANSPEKLSWFRSQITGLLAGGGVGRLVVDHYGSELWSNVRLASKTKFATRGPAPTTARFQIQLWAADPRLFGASQSFAGVSGELVWAHHYGNFTASPKVRVSGSMHSGYTVWGPGGRRFTVTVPVVSAFPHTIDMHTGLLWVNGAVVHGAVTFADTWGVPAGGRVEYQLTPVEGSGSLLVTVEDTFI